MAREQTIIFASSMDGYYLSFQYTSNISAHDHEPQRTTRLACIHAYFLFLFSVYGSARQQLYKIPSILHDHDDSSCPLFLGYVPAIDRLGTSLSLLLSFFLSFFLSFHFSFFPSSFLQLENIFPLPRPDFFNFTCWPLSSLHSDTFI